MDWIADTGAAGSAMGTAVAGTSQTPVGLGIGAALGGVLTVALLYDLSRTIADTKVIPLPGPRQSMTVYHYTTFPPNSFVNGLLPASSATDYPGLTAESASAGLGIPPPTLVYPVTFNPQTTRLIMGVVPGNKYGPGGLVAYYFPNGTPAGSVGPPTPVPSFKVP